MRVAEEDQTVASPISVGIKELPMAKGFTRQTAYVVAELTEARCRMPHMRLTPRERGCDQLCQLTN